jgi:hypothetical protein
MTRSSWPVEEQCPKSACSTRLDNGPRHDRRLLTALYAELTDRIIPDSGLCWIEHLLGHAIAVAVLTGSVQDPERAEAREAGPAEAPAMMIQLTDRLGGR